MTLLSKPRLDIVDILRIRKSSLQAQFSLFIFLFASLLVVSLGFFVLRQEKRVLTRERILIGQTLARHLASASRQGILLDDDLAIFEAIDDLMKKAESGDVQYAFVTDPEGTIIAHHQSQRMGQKVGDSLSRAALVAGALLIRETRFEGEPVLDFASPIVEKSHGKKIGVARLGLSSASVLRVVEEAARNILFVSATALFLGLLAAMAWVRVITRPIAEVARGAEMIGAGDLSHKIEVKSKNEIGELAAVFNKMTGDLAEAQDKLIAARQLEHELALARGIQASLLPERLPSEKNFDVTAFYRAAQEIGGDYYDFIDVDEHHLGIAVADVSGKSIPGAFVMGIARTLLRSFAPGDLSPARVLSRVNEALSGNIKRGMFVTMMYMVVHRQERHARVASAGHLPLFYWSAGPGSHRWINPPGPALGVRGTREFNAAVSEAVIELSAGDLLALSTDGINEAMNAHGDPFGDERLILYFIRNARLPVEKIKQGLVEVLSAFTGGTEQSDDITLVLLKAREA